MLLSIAAALFHGTAYAIYFVQVSNGGSVPNPASWSVWAFLSALNALSFWKASKDPLATTQFFTGAGACFGVWVFAITTGKFAPLDTMSWVVLIFCFVACAIWYMTKNATYANLVVCAIFIVSSIPTLLGVWRNGNMEQPIPWYLWTTAFVLTAINVVRRRDRTNPRWWFLLAIPIYGIVFHGLIAICAAR